MLITKMQFFFCISSNLRDIKYKQLEQEHSFIFCAIVLYLVVYHVCFQDGKLCLLVANDKLDGK
jgi:hypothetical protein